MSGARLAKDLTARLAVTSGHMANILNLMVMPMANTPKRTNVTMHLT